MELYTVTSFTQNVEFKTNADFIYTLCNTRKLKHT